MHTKLEVGAAPTKSGPGGAWAICRGVENEV